MVEPMKDKAYETEATLTLVQDTLRGPIVEVTEALRNYDVLQPLHPERFWLGNIAVASEAEASNPQGLPVEVDFDKKQRLMMVTIGEHTLDDYMSSYAGDENPQTKHDLLQLFTGYALVHDLTIRALSPEKVPDFIEHISQPNGLYNDLLGSGILDDSDNEKLVREYLIGDDDRIAKVSVARFAVGAVCEAMLPADRGFRRRITSIFRPELETFLRHGKKYRQTAQEKFYASPERAIEMLAEHVKDFDLAAAFPKSGQEVSNFVEIYAEV